MPPFSRQPSLSLNHLHEKTEKLNALPVGARHAISRSDALSSVQTAQLRTPTLCVHFASLLYAWGKNDRRDRGNSNKSYTSHNHWHESVSIYLRTANPNFAGLADANVLAGVGVHDQHLGVRHQASRRSVIVHADWHHMTRGTTNGQPISTVHLRYQNDASRFWRWWNTKKKNTNYKSDHRKQKNKSLLKTLHNNLQKVPKHNGSWWFELDLPQGSTCETQLFWDVVQHK